MPTTVQVLPTKTVRYVIDGQERACFIPNTESTCTRTWSTLLKEKVAKHPLWSESGTNAQVTLSNLPVARRSRKSLLHF